MKKKYIALIFLVLFAAAAFGDTGEQEEIDFLLFMPNSGNEFVAEAQAMIQLDKLAKYLTSRELVPGQIHIFGYAAIVVNDIAGTDLSRDRALFVMRELQRRGVPADLFAAPVAFGEVDLWGSNADEEDRSPNRRVRVVLDGSVLTPAVIQAVPPISPPAEPVKQESKPEEPKSQFPWWVLLIPLLAPLVDLVSIQRQLLVLAYTFGDGFSNVFYPTNPALLIALSLGGFSYGQWFRRTWPFFLALLVFTSLVLFTGLAIGYK